MKQGIILNGINNSLKGRKENYTHEEKFIKEGEKSHCRWLVERRIWPMARRGEFKAVQPLRELTRLRSEDDVASGIRGRNNGEP